MAGTFHRRRSNLLKTGSFRHEREPENTKEKSRQCCTVNEIAGFGDLNFFLLVVS
jgi:hypothetical protein